MFKLPVNMPDVTEQQDPVQGIGHYTIEFKLPGPWSKKFVSEDATMPVEFTPEKPNRLGAEAVRVRLYEPEEQVSSANKTPDEQPVTLVWAHGGAFKHGGLDSPESHWFATPLAEQGVRVITVDYSLATDTLKAPAPANEMGAVLKWVRSKYEGRILVGGASAGANIAAHAAFLHAADVLTGVSTPIDGLILLYPTMHRKQEVRLDIEQLLRELPIDKRRTAEIIAQMYDNYIGSLKEKPESSDNYSNACTAGFDSVSSPVTADNNGSGRSFYSEIPIVIGELDIRELAGLPRTLIVNAQLDDFRASGEQFAKQLMEANVPVETITINQAMHGFMTPERGEHGKQLALETIDFILHKVKGWHTR